MLQTTTKHLPGRFRRCRACGQEPTHVITRGSHANQPVQFAPIAPRHSLECRCQRTALHPLLLAAEAEWDGLHSRRPRSAMRRAAA